MIKLEKVSKRLKTFSLKNLSFELPAGYICGLIGENGSGKTTLIHILAGLYSLDEGEMNLFGMNYLEHEQMIKNEIGVVLHGDIFERKETLIENANYYGRFYTNYDAQAMKDYLSRFHLEEKRKYKTLSKGEKMKFAFAFALSHHPKLLLLDEPNANFDAEFQKEFHDILKEFIRDGTRSVLLSTHITSDVERFTDYILFLKNGRQLLFGDIESVRESYRMVSGEAYKIKLLEDRVIYIEQGQLTCNALVKHRNRAYDSKLTVWKPSVTELMYYMVKGDKR